MAVQRCERLTGEAASGGNGTNGHDRFGQCLAERIGRHRYDMWFGHAKLRDEGQTLEVATDSGFVARWIDEHFSEDLHHVATATLGDGARVSVCVKPELFPVERDEEAVAGASAPASRPGETPALPTPSARASFRRLDEFVIGQSNRLAIAQARQLVEDPEATMISPLFVHGECGVGKTHLLQGICRCYTERCGRPHAARYVTGEQFTNEYIAAIRTNTLEQFRRRMRKVDLLAIDDVHFLSNKVRTQGEFLHTLDALGLSGARVVMTSDEHPRQIRRFSRALVSRFLSGMVVQIERPDRETRRLLIRRLAESRGLSLSDAAVQRIASQCVGSVRELEGAITKLAAVHAIARQSERRTEGTGEVGMVLVEQLFSERTWQPAVPVRIGQVIDAVCELLGVTRSDLMGSGRHRRVVLGRGLVAFLGRELTTHSYPEIAEALGRTYHSTVHTAARRLRNQLQEDELVRLAADEPAVALRELVDQLRHAIVRSASHRTGTASA
ncbi:MAG: DnaA ATPase domain-containing protein [Planctomycetota bacterium]